MFTFTADFLRQNEMRQKIVLKHVTLKTKVYCLQQLTSVFSHINYKD